VLPR